MEERLNQPTGAVVTRFNYHRPKWFGGFFGEPVNHNKSGNCTYPPALTDVISAENLNKLVEPMYTMTPILAYHLSITVFLALSVLTTVLQQGYTWFESFAIITGTSASYLHALGIIWYITWVLGVVVIVPLYYVSLHNVERFFVEENEKSFKDLGVRVKIHKNPPGRFLLIPGFKRIDSLEFSRA